VVERLKPLYMIDPANWEDFKVKREPGQVGHWKIDHFTIEPDKLEYWYHHSKGRDPGLGDFTGLYYQREHPAYQRAVQDEYSGKHQWFPMMSDTKAEVVDHFEFLDKVAMATEWGEDTSVCITGLGLGLVAEHCLRMGVGSVTVVDVDPEVIELVAGQIDHPNLRVIQADAYTWQPDRKFDFVWHDIWATISDANWPEMQRIRENYRRATRYWQGCWAYERVKWMCRTERQDPTGILRMLREPLLDENGARSISLYVQAQTNPEEAWAYLANVAEQKGNLTFVRHLWQSMTGSRPPGERLVLP
jgi:hypothetical protein